LSFGLKGKGARRFSAWWFQNLEKGNSIGLGYSWKFGAKTVRHFGSKTFTYVSNGGILLFWGGKRAGIKPSSDLSLSQGIGIPRAGRKPMDLILRVRESGIQGFGDWLPLFLGLGRVRGRRVV